MPGSSIQAAPLLVARIVHAALAASVLLYAGIAAAIAPAAATIDGTLETVLWVAALVAAISATRLYRTVPARGERTGVMAVSAPPAATSALPIPAVLAWALFEAVGILGLVIRLVGGTTGWWLLAGSLALLAVHPPRREWFPPEGGAR